MKLQGSGFSNGFKCGDMHIFEILNTLPINIYELNFYHDDKRWKHKLIPIEISKGNTVYRVVDFLIYKNFYVLIKKLNVFVRKEVNKSICRRCLNSLPNHDVLNNHMQKYGQQEITCIKTSKESHI